ncbi:protein disulfide oxidoreductase [Sulfurimonas sp. MAG313]|nr:protein disulfide oxidoreductase [Sulfurimonas sp. MAG313]MDF1880356.1 protein disulfide oxidoreductase [Sulfurimonas sp. MAG313]
MENKKTLKGKLKHYSKEIISMALILFIVSNALSYFRAPDIKDKNLPDISGFLTNQELFSTKDFKDGPTLIHVWATWCPTCKIEAANIQSVSQEYNVLSIAVKSGTDEKINSYLKKNGLDFKVINDLQGRLAQKFLVQAYPTSFIYDKNKTLVFSEVGYTSTWGLKLRMWWASL